MDLEQFAKHAGVELVDCDCDPRWSGPIGYRTKDHPNSTYCGFRTANAAYRHWLGSTFGEHAAKAVLKLIKAASRPSKAPQ